MAKNNEYVGVDEKYVPEEEQKKTYVKEPIIDEENTQRIRAGINRGVNKLTSEENQEKIKKGAKKGWKIAKRVGIGYLFFVCLSFGFVITAIVAITVSIINSINVQNEMVDDFNNKSSGMLEKHNESSTNNSKLELNSGVIWRTFVSDDLGKIFTNNQSGEHLISVVNGDTKTTDPQEIRVLANSIKDEELSKKYSVTIEYGDDGYVKTYTFEEF